MQYHWQFWIVMVCVLLAGWRMGRRIWQGIKAWGGTGSCGGCHGCATGSNAEPTVVQLELSQEKGERGA